MADLDLTRGRPEASSDRPRPGPSATAEAARKRAEETLKGELEGVFGRISDILAAREDEELSSAFAEDKRVLSAGLLSITSSLPFLRTPLVLVVHLVEPVLAFGRIVGILARRLRSRFYEEGEAPPEG